MSAELLRRAAKLLRERAEAATAGPWESLDDGDRLIAWRKHPEWVGADDFVYVVDEPISNTANAEYIALMHPPVALALAELLDRYATDCQIMRCEPADAYTALARAILREPEAVEPR